MPGFKQITIITAVCPSCGLFYSITRGESQIVIMCPECNTTFDYNGNIDWAPPKKSSDPEKRLP